MATAPAPITVFHVPVCPFSQRLEILLTLKGRRNDVHFHVVDITQPRPEWLLAKSGGSTALPILETADGQILRESLIILQYLEDVFPEPAVAQRDPYRRAVEGLMTRMEAGFGQSGYLFVMNQDPERREALRDSLLQHYGELNDFLLEHSPSGTFLFEQFGWAETVFTPLFMRFWFLEYFEDFELPPEPWFARVRTWREACLAHPAAQQVSREQIVKLYVDYAHGAGNGALLPGRQRSSFVLEPDWRTRPWPPRQKYGPVPSDAELGL
jgi:glutathione S-transferase